MTDDVMERLMDVQPMPRGERLACWHKSVFYAVDLLEESKILYAIWHSTGGLTVEGKATLWRAYAAPLRNARAERRKHRSNAAMWKHAYSVAREMLIAEIEHSQRMNRGQLND